MDFFIDKCIPVLSLVISLISTIIAYKTFHSNNDGEQIIDNKILQINPIYFNNFFYQSDVISDNTDTIKYKNRKWIVNLIFFVYLITLLFCFFYYTYSMYDFSSLLSFFTSSNKILSYRFITVLIKCLHYVTIFSIIYSLTVLGIFYNRRETILKNLFAMKYYSIKIITDCVLLHLLKDFSSNEKVMIVYILLFLFLLFFQCNWFYHSLEKSFCLILPSAYLPNIVLDIARFFPAYLCPVFLYLIIGIINKVSKILQ